MTASVQSLGYLPVSIAVLQEAAVLDFDLYLQRAGREFVELYRGKNYPLTKLDLIRLDAAGVDRVYIHYGDAGALQKYLRKMLRESGISTSVRLRALRDLTRAAFEDALRIGDCKAVATVAASFGRDLAGMLAEQTPALEEIFKTLDHDYYTFTHALGIAAEAAVQTGPRAIGPIGCIYATKAAITKAAVTEACI